MLVGIAAARNAGAVRSFTVKPGAFDVLLCGVGAGVWSGCANRTTVQSVDFGPHNPTETNQRPLWAADAAMTLVLRRA